MINTAADGIKLLFMVHHFGPLYKVKDQNKFYKIISP